MASKKSPREREQLYLEERKVSINEIWDKFFEKEVVDQKELGRLMDEMNRLDKMIIAKGRRDLLK